MISQIIGTKIDIGRKFTQEGNIMPVTKIKAGPCWVVGIRNKDKDGYSAIQLGLGEKEIIKTKKPLQGYLKGANLKKAPFWFVEVGVDDSETSKFKIGDYLKISDIFKPNDKVKVAGWSKGKGFTGVVKRWGFKGGPRTHGQSDRERAPGSIGQATTPGRVYKGKKMAGRSGNARVTISGLMVTEVNDGANILEIKGIVPGPKNGRLIISKQNG